MSRIICENFQLLIEYSSGSHFWTNFEGSLVTDKRIFSKFAVGKLSISSNIQRSALLKRSLKRSLKDP